MNREEFKVLVMLYAANIDGNINPDEVDAILEKVDSNTFKNVKKMFAKMSDIEILNTINENKKSFASTDTEREILINDCRTIINADGQQTVMEGFIVKMLEKVLN